MRDPGNEVDCFKENHGKLFVIVRLMDCRIRKISIHFTIFSPEIAQAI